MKPEIFLISSLTLGLATAKGSLKVESYSIYPQRFCLAGCCPTWRDCGKTGWLNNN